MCLSGGSFTCAYGPVLNPHDRAINANGSSSGSAALVAVGAVDIAISVAQGGDLVEHDLLPSNAQPNHSKQQAKGQ